VNGDGFDDVHLNDLDILGGPGGLTVTHRRPVALGEDQIYWRDELGPGDVDGDGFADAVRAIAVEKACALGERCATTSNLTFYRGGPKGLALAPVKRRQ
jgi:hypothetical protein